jgi:uncharacterized protein (TIGR03382 family)
VRITGEVDGTEGSSARYGARIVREFGPSVEYVEVPFVDEVGSVDVPGVGEETAIWLSIGAWTDRDGHWETEQFELDWSLEVVEPEIPTTPVDSGTEPTDTGTAPDDTGSSPDDTGKLTIPPISCDCDGTGGAPVPLGLGAVVLAIVTRRRRSRG